MLCVCWITACLPSQSLPDVSSILNPDDIIMSDKSHTLLYDCHQLMKRFQSQSIWSCFTDDNHQFDSCLLNTDPRHCEHCEEVFAELEKIQDEASKYGIRIVANSERAAINKLKLAKMVDFPSLVFFHRKEPTIYEGEWSMPSWCNSWPDLTPTMTTLDHPSLLQVTWRTMNRSWNGFCHWIQWISRIRLKRLISNPSVISSIIKIMSQSSSVSTAWSHHSPPPPTHWRQMDDRD